MARRAGAVNGLIVFVLGLVIVAAVSGAVTGLAGTHGVVRGLRNVGLPTTWSRWRDVAGLGGVVAVVAMVVGSMAGGILGERWHTKLLARALDPAIGPEVRTRPARTDDEVDVRDGVGGAADGDRLAAAQRDEADRVAAEGTAEIRVDCSNTRHHHFIRR